MSEPLQTTIWGDAELEKAIQEAKANIKAMPDHVCGITAMVVKEAGQMVDASLALKYKHFRRGKNHSDVKEELKAHSLRVVAVAYLVYKSLKNE